MVLETFKAEETNLEGVFEGKKGYNIPRYQREYSWTKEEIIQFCEDIKDSYEKNEDYLLGSIILIKDSNSNNFEVVDGQQRLTTTSIFLSVLREFLIEDIDKEDISDMITRKSKDLRVDRLNPDSPNFSAYKEISQRFDPQAIKNKLNKKINKKNKYYLNALSIYEYFEDMEKENVEFKKFYNHFIKKICVIRVVTEGLGKAMRLFEVLNSRGLPLKNSDLIKNHIIENIFENCDDSDFKKEEESFTNIWKKYSRRLDDELEEEMEDLFTYYIYSKTGENPRKNIFEEFKKILSTNFKSNVKNKIKIQEFLKEFNQFSEEYLSLFESSSIPGIENLEFYKRIWQMKGLKEGRFWKAIIMAYELKDPQDKEGLLKLIKLLFKFYYLSWFAGESVNKYKQISFKIIKSINLGEFNFNDLEELINGYFKDRRVLTNANGELNGDIYSQKWAKFLLLILEHEIGETISGSKEIQENIQSKKVTIEHIYPDNAKIKDSKIEEKKNFLGNLTLLSGSKNSSFSNQDYLSKKTLYKSGKIPKFALSKEVFDRKEDTWTEEDILLRQKKLIEKIEDIFNLEKGSLSINSTSENI